MAILVGLACFPVVLADLTPDAPRQFDFHALLFPVDLALLAAVVVAVRARKVPPLAGAAAVVLVTFAAAWVFHPSIRGGESLLRWAGVVAIVALVDRAAVVVLTGGWAVLESVVALAQKVHDGPLGLPAVGEGALSFVRFGDALAPPGTLVHPYLLAGLALLGGAVLAGAARRRERRWLLLPAAVAVAPVGFTYSRAALVSLALVLVCLAVARFPAAVLALALGAGIPALFWADGWVSRAETTTATTTPGDGLDTGRLTLMRQAGDLVREHPLTGVGPGRYVTALSDRGVDTSGTGGMVKPVHNVPLLAAAEGGVVAGLAMLALLLVAVVTAVRAGPLAAAVAAAFLPFCLLDHFPYTFPQGLVMTGLWLGALATAVPSTRHQPGGISARSGKGSSAALRDRSGHPGMPAL